MNAEISLKYKVINRIRCIFFLDPDPNQVSSFIKRFKTGHSRETSRSFLSIGFDGGFWLYLMTRG